MMIRTLLTATAAMALLAGGAQAGEGAKKKAQPAAASASQMGSDTSSQAASPSGMATPDQSMSGSVNPPMSADASTAGVDASASAPTNVRVVTNGPVADTPENRAKFPPLSKTGRNTTPRGN